MRSSVVELGGTHRHVPELFLDFKAVMWFWSWLSKMPLAPLPGAKVHDCSFHARRYWQSLPKGRHSNEKTSRLWMISIFSFSSRSSRLAISMELPFCHYSTPTITVSSVTTNWYEGKKGHYIRRFEFLRIYLYIAVAGYWFELSLKASKRMYRINLHLHFVLKYYSHYCKYKNPLNSTES